MNKIKILLIVFAILFLVFYFTRPKNYKVERSIIIEASPNQIWDQVAKFENWQKWSPWLEKDSSVENTYEGKPGSIGAKTKYTSKESGSGEMTCTYLQMNEEIKYDMHFFEPWESESKGYIKLNKTAEGTEVIWGFEGKNNFFSKFINMDKMIGPDFKRGLELLKRNIESMPKQVNYQIKEEKFRTKKYLGIKNVNFPIENFTSDLFATSYNTISKQKANFGNGAPSAIYYDWDQEKGLCTVAIAIPLNDKPDAINKELSYIEINENQSFYVNYYGAYQNMEPVHQAIDMHIKNQKIEGQFIAIEEYITDPVAEIDTSKWLTKISYVKL